MENENSNLEVQTPTRVGPPSDPVLLGEQADNVTFQNAIEAYTKYGHELQHLQEEGQKTISTAIERLRSNAGNTSVESIQHKGQNLYEVLIDFEDTSIPTRSLSEVFALSTLSLAVFAISSLISEYLLGPLATVFIQPLGAAIVSSIIIPVFIYSYIDNNQALIGAQMILLTGAIQGFLSGSACSHLALSSEPIVPLSAVVSSFAITLADQRSRLSALKIVGGVSLGIHLTYGLFSGLLSFPYITLSLLYTAAVLVPIQLGARDKKNASVNYYSIVVLSLTVAARGVIYGLAGMTSEELNAASKSK
ncbi:unnamed protein product [Caenorhabditis angaria]|uniref:Uncharacterized protein n=1 Tax=Caenorhabditis angaria TaxID=860376 RepID=A0A9P1IJN8_9PELO|nr:unnamed protein product [Caenorhabditis angaria]